MTRRIDPRKKVERNKKLADRWSLIHIGSGVLVGWIMNPFAALALMAMYEPIEVFILSPIFARFGIVFGYEALRNSLSDIFFDAIGITIGAALLAHLVTSPFHLF